MAKSRVPLLRQLETSGYLTLNQFVKYLADYAPEASISYPTAIKAVKLGHIQTKRVGRVHRVMRSEIERWIAEGNWGRIDYSGPYPRHL